MSDKKIWSLSTTVRNPERIFNFLKELEKLEGKVWDNENQKNFQSLLIQSRQYVPTHANLSTEQIELLENIDYSLSFKEAREIFDSKKYQDSAMRGRTSFSPIEKTGLAFIDDEIIENKKSKVIKITKTGNLLLEEKIDLSECTFKSLIKLQYPNPSSKDFTEEMGYNIKPFLAILSFLIRVEKLFRKENLVYNGITKQEFGIFAISLCNHVDIDKHVNDLFEFRKETLKIKNNKEKNIFIENYKEEYLKDFSNRSNIKDYVDNTLRNFRLTGYIRVRGNGNYIDLEINRQKQIEKLIFILGLSADNFLDFNSYQNYLGDYDLPILPWENINDFIEINNSLKEKILRLDKNSEKYICVIDENDTIELIKRKIKKNRETYSSLINNTEYEVYEKNKELLVEDIKNNSDPLELERLVTFGLKLLVSKNEVISNCPMGDDGFPTSHAPGKFPDIEIMDKNIFGIAEVTMMKSRDQFYAEGQPVLRHHVDFINKHDKENSFCLFIAPSIHRDTINAFWFACKYEYEGKKRKIVPITIEQFCKILKNKNKSSFIEFIENSTDVKKIKDSIEWSNHILNLI